MEQTTLRSAPSSQPARGRPSQGARGRAKSVPLRARASRPPGYASRQGSDLRTRRSASLRSEGPSLSSPEGRRPRGPHGGTGSRGLYSFFDSTSVAHAPKNVPRAPGAFPATRITRGCCRRFFSPRIRGLFGSSPPRADFEGILKMQREQEVPFLR